MTHRSALAGAVALAAVLCGSPGSAAAAQARFRYVPVDAAGNTSLKPAGPCCSIGERVTWFGTVRAPNVNQPRPTHMVTFCHPYTGRNVTVPMTFPEGTPRIEHRRNRLIYNYGSYTVEAHFFPDGSVDVVYDSGLFRAI
jgi:hypothetical protein